MSLRIAKVLNQFKLLLLLLANPEDLLDLQVLRPQIQDFNFNYLLLLLLWPLSFVLLQGLVNFKNFVSQ